MILGDPIMFSGASKLNIDYGSTAPSDTNKLWVPLSQKPSKVGITSYLAGQVGGMVTEYANIITTSRNLTPVKVGNKLWATSGSLYGGSQYQSSYGDLVIYNPETQKVEKNLEPYNAAYNANNICMINNVVYCAKSYYSEYDSSTGRRYSYKDSTLSIINPETGAKTSTSFYVPITICPFSSVVTDGTKMYIAGNTVSDLNYVNKIWVVSVPDYTKTEYTIPDLYRASRLIYYNNALYMVYNNTDIVAGCITRIGKFDLTTYTFSVIYENSTDMVGSYNWTLTNDGASAFMAYPSSGGEAGATDYTNSTLLFDLSSTKITPTIVSNQKPTTYKNMTKVQAAIGSKIYIFGYGGSYNNNLYYIPYERLLPENELSILATIDSAGINIVDDKKFSINIDPIIVYLGDSNNKAQKTNAYLYDGTQWKDITT